MKRKTKKKIIVIESVKCLECGAPLPIGARYLHGLPHTYYLPCPCQKTNQSMTQENEK